MAYSIGRLGPGTKSITSAQNTSRALIPVAGSKCRAPTPTPFSITSHQGLLTPIKAAKRKGLARSTIYRETTLGGYFLARLAAYPIVPAQPPQPAAGALRRKDNATDWHTP